MKLPRLVVWLYAITFALILVAHLPLQAADQAQWGQAGSRNMVSDETDLPIAADPDTGAGVRWSVDLGHSAYCTPVISQGRVLIGTNNAAPMVPQRTGTRGVLLCLDDRDGSLLWQLVVPRRLTITGTELPAGEPQDPYLDQPEISLCSPPTVEGDRVYVVTNRDEVVCLDLHGLADGNDGPFQDEGQYLVQRDAQPIEVLPSDADILWVFDMPQQAGVYPHDSPHSSILIDGPYLYLNTGNGVDNTHRKIRRPDAPSLIVLDKQTGRLVGQDNEGIGPRIFHCTWSSPARGVVNGRPLIFFCGGDGVVYAFEPMPDQVPAADVHLLQRVWRFDCDPTSPKEDVHQYVGNHSESPSNIMGMPVFYKNCVYVCGGGDFWWGKNEAFIKCIDATGTGDITATGQVWSHPLQRHSCTTPAIVDDMVFVGDLGRMIYCLDAATGQLHWEHDTRGPVWSTLLAADGRLYCGSDDRRLHVLAARRHKQVLATTLLNDRIRTTPVAANGALYVNTLSRLYKFGK